MKVLDFWSGAQEHAMENWSSWIPIIREHFARCASGILEIHCVDSIEISAHDMMCEDWIHIYFHPHVEQIPHNLDLVCALHPDPRSVLHYPSYAQEEDFQCHRYPMMLAHTIENNLTPGGIVVVQFDDQIAELHANQWAERFLGSLDRELEHHCFLKRESLLTSRIWSFPSPIYTFDTLEIFKKHNPN